MSASARPTLGELVARFGGRCGADPSRPIEGVASLASATADRIAFFAGERAGSRYAEDVARSRAAAILVSPKDAAALDGASDRLWICDDPYLQFARMAQWFEDRGRAATSPGTAASAVVDGDAVVDPAASLAAHAVVGRGARVAAGASIGAGSVVGEDCVVGRDTVIHPGVVVYPGCTIGARCIVHSGAVIGADGFGFAQDGVRWVKIPQTGRVVVGDDVEIGANTTIDRGALDDTWIGDGVKLDNQIQIAHNVRIGEHTIMAAFVGIAGSAVIGKRCKIGGAARIMGHVTIADDTVVSTQTFVSRSIARAGHYTGYYPMAEHASFEKNAAVLRRLDGLRERVRRLESDRGGPARPVDGSATDSAIDPAFVPERPA